MVCGDTDGWVPPHSFWFSRSDVGPRISASTEFPAYVSATDLRSIL